MYKSLITLVTTSTLLFAGTGQAQAPVSNNETPPSTPLALSNSQSLLVIQNSPQLQNSNVLQNMQNLQNLQHQIQLQGGADAGGGSRLESTFRLIATSLINSVSNHPDANALCSAELMQVGLGNSKIKVVDTLTDLNTGKPITDQHLDAWTTPGLIQLRMKAWAQYFKDVSQIDDNVKALILHEVYRTTGNFCPDDKGTRSSKVVELLKLPTLAGNKIFAFKYPATGFPDGAYHPGPHNPLYVFADGIACEKPVDFRHPVDGVQCVVSGNYSGEESFVAVVTTTRELNNGLPFSVLVNAPSYTSIPNIIGNMLKFASPTQPLYLVYNLQSGALQYGFDLENLTAVQ